MTPGARGGDDGRVRNDEGHEGGVGGSDGGGFLPGLSVSIVCMDNIATIGRCVESVRGIADEVVAVDSGSSDGTIEVLEEAGARVIRQPWLGFVKQKQFAFDRCGRAWVLHLDSDESLEPELAASVRRAVEADPDGKGEVGAYEVNRKVWWAGGFLHHAWQPEWRVRLVQRRRARWAGYDPHDRMEPTEAGVRTAKLAGDMRHDSIERFTSFLAKQAQHAEVGAASYDEMGRRAKVSKLVTSPVGAWTKQMVLRGAWRDGWRGWCAAGATAAGAFMKHAALLERQRGRGGKS